VPRPEPERAAATLHALYARHAATIRRYLARLVGEADAEDLVQDVFERAQRMRWRNTTRASQLRGLYRIARNAAVDRHRSNAVREREDTVAALRDDTDGRATPPDTELMRARTRTCILGLVERLAPGQRDVVLLSELRGLTVREAAGVLGVSLDAAKIRLHRGRRALRDLVDRECRTFRDERNELSCEPAARGTADDAPYRSTDHARLIGRSAHSSEDVMPRFQVFDPPMCCSTGVCGAEVDPTLVRFAADLEWLKESGVEIERFNLAQAPAAFAANPVVAAALRGREDGLPLVLLDGKVVAQGSYPSREVLAELAGLALPKSVYTEAVQELVAIGAAIAANCEPCFRYHFDKARKLGVSKEDMARAVTTAQTVKESPARAVLALAEKYTGSRIVTKDGRDACRPAPDGEPSSPTPGKCC
jgi:RNA polymerase sigma factor (sigma-70 family)